MKRKRSFVLDEKDEKAVELFTDLGMPRNLAKTLIYIAKAQECRSAEIEHQANLRQPEVSVAMHELQKRGWVNKRDLKKKGKGRPVHIYSLTSDINTIINNFEQEKIKQINLIKKDLDELKNLIENK